MYIQPKVTVDIATVQSPGIVKPDGNTITIDNNGTITSSVDLTDYIEKSSTEGLVMNDGTIDTTEYATKEDIPSIPMYRDTFIDKTWNGYTSFSGNNVWTDDENVYYSFTTTQYVLDKSTSTWSTKSWTGLSGFEGHDIWRDGETIYLNSSESGSKKYNKTTGTWSKVTWTGLTTFYGQSIWTDGENIYHSSGSKQYVLNRGTTTWVAKTWNGMNSFTGNCVWTDGTNIYYSSAYNSTHMVLDKATSTWSSKTWNYNVDASYIWTDGVNTYYSNNDVHKVLDKTTGNWVDKTWIGLSSFYGSEIWEMDGHIYYSYGTTSVQKELVSNTQPIATTSSLGISKPDGTTITIDGDGTLHSTGVVNSVIAPLEEGTTASQAYAVGSHFIRSGAFCTVIAAIASGDTLTANTNYTAGTLAALLNYMETTVTLSTSTTTTATFTNAAITTNSCVEVGVSEWDLVPDNVTVTTGVCTVTFPSVDSAHTVTVRLYLR